MRKLLIKLIPEVDRDLVVRELDDIADSRPPAGRGAWYNMQLVQFAVRLRAERLRQLPISAAALASDMAYAARRLFRRPAYLGTAALTLGLGIGGTVTVYAAANWVLLREVPGVTRPDQIVQVRLETTEDGGSNVTWGISHPDFQDMRNRMPSLTAMAAAADHDIQIGVSGGSPERLSAQLVTPEFFELLELTPLAGRFFFPGDHQGLTGPAEVVVSHNLALRHWGDPRASVGTSISINGSPYDVIGVAPAGFRGAELPGTAEAWLAATAIRHVRPRQTDALTGGSVQLWTQLIGRRAPGVTMTRVAQEANGAMNGIRDDRNGAAHSFYATHFVFRVYDGIGLDPWVRADVRRTLTILGAASLLLLTLTAANVANLGIARTATRRSEMAIRRALGAGVFRVAREPLLEGVVVGVGGAVIGGSLALAAERVFGEASLAARGASLEGMELDWRVYVFCFGVALVFGVLSAVAPALTSRPYVVSTTLAGYRQGSATQRRLSGSLVVTQVAVSTVLAITAGLFTRTVFNLQNIDLLFEPERAVTFSVDPGLNGYDDTRAVGLLRTLNRQLQTIPGVRAAGLIYPAPLKGRYITAAAKRPEQTDDELRVGAGFEISGRGVLDALGIHLTTGRMFRSDLGEPDAYPDEVILSEGMAAAVFPGVDPRSVVGRVVTVGFRGEPRSVVGIVPDARIASPRSEPQRYMLRPYTVDFADGGATFYVRTDRPIAQVMGDVGRVVTSIDPDLPIFDTGTGGDKVRALLVEQRVLARLATVLGVLGLVLAAVGLYGVLAYTVTERRREIGIQSALGATCATVTREVLGRGLRFAIGGLMLAFPITYLAGRLVASRLYGISFLDPQTLTGGALILILVALIASWLPAMRATRVSPLEALRAD